MAVFGVALSLDPPLFISVESYHLFDVTIGYRRNVGLVHLVLMMRDGHKCPVRVENEESLWKRLSLKEVELISLLPEPAFHHKVIERATSSNTLIVPHLELLVSSLNIVVIPSRLTELFSKCLVTLFHLCLPIVGIGSTL